MNFVYLPFSVGKFICSPHSIEKPVNFHKMAELAKIVAQDMTFVRVDFYEANAIIYAGEITLFPSAGYGFYKPPEWEKILGDMLVLQKK
jgi:hypothetical protein